MGACSYCGRKHEGVVCPPQQYYEVNPLSDYLKIDDLFSVIRSQSSHIIALENLLKEKDSVTKFVEVPIETNTEKVALLKDFLRGVLRREIEPQSVEEWSIYTQEARKIIADLQTTLEFIKAATQKNI